jgi:hypothetical protein
MTEEEIVAEDRRLLKLCVEAYDRKDYDNPVHEQHASHYRKYKTLLDNYMRDVVAPNIKAKLTTLFAKSKEKIQKLVDK